MVSLLLGVGIAVAVFVGFNIGGSSTGVAFGPAVGSRIVGKVGAGVLMTAFALLGAWISGRNVVETMGGRIVPAPHFSIEASVVVLFFTGAALLVSNLFGVPASTSMTAVGAIVGLGIAVGDLNQAVMFRIVSAWLIAPVIAFWIGGTIGRYLYPTLDERFAFSRIEGSLLEFDRSKRVPRPRLGEESAPRDVLGAALVLIIACYMAYAAGASNAANAVAPLVGNGSLGIDVAILLAVGAIGLGGFTIARRTLDTVGSGLTDLPILAALIVSTVSATIITVLSQLGIPASLAVSSTMCILGLGWGRASRAVSLTEVGEVAREGTADAEISMNALSTGASGDKEPGATVGSLAAGEKGDPSVPGGRKDTDGTDAASTEGANTGSVATDGSLGANAGPTEEDGEEDEELTAGDLFDPAATARIVVLWILTPTVSALGSYLLFVLVPIAG